MISISIPPLCVLAPGSQWLFSLSCSLVSAQWGGQLSPPGCFHHWPAAWEPGCPAGTFFEMLLSQPHLKLIPAILQHPEQYFRLINIVFSLSSSQILSQMTPQTITEIDALLGNKPHSKKELRAWKQRHERRVTFKEDGGRQWHWETLLFCSAVYSTTCMSSATLCFQ